MNSFSKNNIKFDHTYSVRYTLGNSEFETVGDDNVSVKQYLTASEYGFTARLCIKNTADTAVFLKNAYPLCINSLSIGNLAPKDIIILNHGRHKNDLPSVCASGRRNDAFSDSVNRLTEQGMLENIGNTSESILVGDQIGVFRSESASLAIYFSTADIQLTEIITQVSEHDGIQSICAGGSFNCLLKPGAEIYTDTVEINTNPDSFSAINSYACGVAKSKGVTVPCQKPAVYSTWYYYGKEITEQQVITNIDGIVRLSLPFTHFQIDAGWEKNYGDWEPNEKFPSGISKIADSIKSAGMEAGIWTCPIIAHPDSPICSQHKDWLLYHNDGTPCIFDMNKRLYYVFDCTNPQYLKWLEQLYKKLVSWGYSYHKLDFTRAFPIQTDVKYYNPHLTPVQAYVNAIKAVKRGIGNNGYLLICGGLYQPLVGIADGERTGSDIKSMWYDDNGQPKIPFTVKQNVLRYFMNEWWHNDADSLAVRRNISNLFNENELSLGLLNDDEAITFTANQYFSGGLIGSTEPPDIIEHDRLYLLRHIMPVLPTKVKPISMFSGERFPSVIDVYVEKGWHTLCFVNWTDTSQTIEFELTPDIAKIGKSFYVASFFGKEIIFDAKLGDKVILGTVPPHGTEIVKIAPSDVPQIVKSDCHFSMGGETELLVDGSTVTFSTSNRYPIDMHYTLAFPNGDLHDVTVPANTEFKKQFNF